MEEKELYGKYLEGKHWEKHPTIYAESFSDFLRRNYFDGLIVDLGCGDGRDVNVFSKNGLDSLGVDYSESKISLARQKFGDLKFEVKNVEDLKFGDSSIGAFFMINVIHYVNKEKALDEIFRTVKSGGYFFVHFNLEIVDKNGKVDYSHDVEDIMNLVRNFKVIRQKKLKRFDSQPVEHTHEILELVLRKP